MSLSAPCTTLSRIAGTHQANCTVSQPTFGIGRDAHPFHPLRGQQFSVLKVRKVSGVETLSLHHNKLGSIAVPREWTNWAPPGSQSCLGEQRLLADPWGLVALAELVTALEMRNFEVAINAF